MTKYGDQYWEINLSINLIQYIHSLPPPIPTGVMPNSAPCQIMHPLVLVGLGVGEGLGLWVGLGLGNQIARGCIIWQGCRFRHNTGPRIELATFGLWVWLSNIRPRLPTLSLYNIYYYHKYS